MIRASLVLLAGMVAAGCGLFEPDPETWGMPDAQKGRAENARFATLVDAYLSWHYAAHPVKATFDGIHSYDDRLQDLSAAAVAAEIAAQRRWLDRVVAVDRSLLSLDASVDHELLESAVRAVLVDLEEVRSWEREPGVYVNMVSSGLYCLAALQFAPQERRMALAARRLEQVPAVLDAGRVNLKTPPAILTEMAIEDAAGARTFIETSLPAAFPDVKDEPLKVRFERARKGAIAAVSAFESWMKTDLEPRSTAPVGLGEELFRRKLAAEEMVETPVAALLSEGEGLLDTVRERMLEIAAGIDKDKPPQEVIRETASEHPPAGELLDSVRS